MCRNIRTLYHFEPPVTDGEIRAAALQFVRKVSGFAKPSTVNQAPFDHAVPAPQTAEPPQSIAEVPAELRTVLTV